MAFANSSTNSATVRVGGGLTVAADELCVDVLVSLTAVRTLQLRCEKLKKNEELYSEELRRCVCVLMRTNKPLTC